MLQLWVWGHEWGVEYFWLWKSGYEDNDKCTKGTISSCYHFRYILILVTSFVTCKCCITPLAQHCFAPTYSCHFKLSARGALYALKGLKNLSAMESSSCSSRTASDLHICQKIEKNV